MKDSEGTLQILLTNDDGIRSPGLWAAAEALSDLGYVTVAAPREQCSGSGRSMPPRSDGRVQEERLSIGGGDWKVYAVGGSPAQAVQHAILEIMPQKPDLVVAGINYGENLTVGITISGTVGAALEGSAFGIPSLAVSLEMPQEYYFSHSMEIDFSVAGYFAALFGRHLLERPRIPDVDVLKVDVPCDATEETEWRLTRLSRHQYYRPVPQPRDRLDAEGPIGFEVVLDRDQTEPDSDVYALAIDRVVSVTPLSLDLTSRVDFHEHDDWLRKRL